MLTAPYGPRRASLFNPRAAEDTVVGVPLAKLDLEANVRISHFRHAVGILILAAVPMLASAQSDNHGVQLAKRGLGQSQPLALNLSQDPGWRLYGFQRDGITYYQVNDLAGRVQLIIGNADDVFWVLPAGDSSAQVSLPEQPIQAPASAVRSLVFQDQTFALVVYRSGAGFLWSVEAVD